MPSATMAYATSGWIPTMTVSAPRSRAISAMLRKRPRPERVEHVQRGDVDDHAAGAAGADLVDQVVLEADHLRVVQGSVDRRDQVAALAQDRDERWSGRHYPPAPSSRVTV